MRIIIVSLSLMLATAAHAQRAPDLATLDRGDGISKFGMDLAFSSIDTPFYDAALRFELHGQHVTHSGFGIYGAFPISHSFGDAPEPMPQPATSIGNLDVGGLFVITNSPTLSWVFRLGVALPTASDGRDGATTNAFAMWPRLTDAALAVPDAWYVRFGFSPLIHVNRLFLQFDLGFDLGTNDDDADELLRVNAGGGIDLGVVALSLELVNLYSFDDFDDDDDWVHTLAFTLRFMGEKWQPFLSLGAPIDDSRDAIKFFFAGGLTFAP